MLTLNFQLSKTPSHQWTWPHPFQEKVKVVFWQTSISQRALCSGLQWSLPFLANLFRSRSSKRWRCCFRNDLLTALYHKNKRPKFGTRCLINVQHSSVKKKTYVCPAYMIAGCPVGIHEGRIFVDLVFKVNSKGIFDDGEAKKNSAVLSSKSSKRFEAKDLASFSKLCFFGNGVGVPFPEVYKSFHVSGSCMEKKTSSESKIFGEWDFLLYFFENVVPYSFVILAILEPSSHSECFMAFTSTWPVLRASVPFWSSLTSSATNKRLT